MFSNALATNLVSNIPSHVVENYARSAGLNLSDANRRAVELSNFLHLCAVSDEQMTPSEVIDSIWHEFILSTRDYAAYCEREFGFLIHHFPRVDGSETVHTYERTRELLRERFGVVDENIWGSGVASAAICDGGR